jgi:hypothetical protein
MVTKRTVFQQMRGTRCAHLGMELYSRGQVLHPGTQEVPLHPLETADED